jgi:hypothetical protein
MKLRKRFEPSRTSIISLKIMAAVLILACSAFAYASYAGFLRVTGSVRRLANCKLNIEAAENVNPDSTTLFQNDPTVFATVDAATRETLSFSTNLVYSEPAKEVTFQIMNVGTCHQRLNNLIVTRFPGNGVVVNWPDLDGIMLPPGSTTGTQVITVEWSSNSTSTTDEIMQAQINYTEYTP